MYARSVWWLYVAVLAATAVTYYRLAPGMTYHFEDTGLSGAVSRSVNYLNYPVAIAAIALVWSCCRGRWAVLAILFAHIVLAIIAVGFTSTFGLLSVRAANIDGDGREMIFALKAIALMSNIAHACFLLLLATGLWMIWDVGYPFTFTWIYLSLILFTVAFLAGTFVMIPSAKRRIAILSERGPDDPEFVALSERAAKLGPALSIIAIILIFLMVAKPL